MLVRRVNESGGTQIVQFIGQNVDPGDFPSRAQHLANTTLVPVSGYKTCRVQSVKMWSSRMRVH